MTDHLTPEEEQGFLEREELRRAARGEDDISPEEQERLLAMRREQVAILRSLGFEVGKDAQCWLREAQLMRDHEDAVQELRERVAKLEELTQRTHATTSLSRKVKGVFRWLTT